MLTGLRLPFATSRLEPYLPHGASEAIMALRAVDWRPGSTIRFIDLVRVPPGRRIPVHRHELDNEEIYVVISGSGRMTVDGAGFPVGQGDVLVNRPGGAHGLQNTAGQDLVLVVVEVDLARGGDAA
jgi:mannose-6-phosphate isomerase-like protein (cupin superfamily)